MNTIKHKTITVYVTMSLLFSLACQASESPPDFTEVDDILLGQRHILRNDDLVASFDMGNNQTGSQFNNIILETTNLHVKNKSTTHIIDSKCSIWRPGSLSSGVPINNVMHSRIGRIFELNHDVTITLAPAADNYGSGCEGLLGLYIKDHVSADNNSLTVVENSSPLWTQLLLADFNQDGFDDVFQNHGGGFAIHTATDVTQPKKGLKRMYSQGIPGDVAATTTPPVAGDFNGDGALDVAWLASKPQDQANLSIYLISICPKAGVMINGIQCQKPFQVLPSSSLDFAKQAIKTQAQLKWPDQNCSGCPNSSNQFWLAAGNYDGRYTALESHQTDELVFVKISDNQNLEIFAYQLGNDLKPINPPIKTIFNKYYHSDGIHLTSGPVNQFSATDQIAFVTLDVDSNTKTELAVIKFDSALKATKHALNVSEEAFNKAGRTRAAPYAQGISIGRFDPPQQGTARDFNAQIAVLYDTIDTVPVDNKNKIMLHIYTVGDASDPKPKFKSEFVIAPTRYDTPHNYKMAAPLQAGDLRGRSLLLGDPDTFQVESHLQPSVILGSPPQHVDYITPSNEDEAAVFNFSAIKKDFYSTYAVQASNENQSSNKSTTSSGWALKESANLKGKVTIGPVEVEGELRQSLDVAEKNTVGKTFNTFQSKTFDASTNTGFGDQIWYSSRRMNVFIYPVLGQFECPNKQKNCTEEEKIPMTVVFSGPDNIHSNISATGRNLEWYQPVHVPGQIFTYPWNQQQLLLQNPDLQSLSQTNTGAFFTDDSSTTRKVNWKSSSGETKSVGFNSSWSLGGGTSVAIGTPEETYKKAGGVKGKVNFDMSYSEGLQTLNTDTSKIGTSTGMAIKKPGNFPNPNNYRFLMEPFIFGSDDSIQRSENTKPDADILTKGPLQTAFAADPTDNNSGSWWSTSDYKKYIDVGFGFPARWEISHDKSKGLIDKETACLSGECAVMDNPNADHLWNSSFYWLRGFYIQSNGKGPQRTAAHVGDSLTLSVRVYNHSMKDMSPTDKLKVRFYGQQWNPNNNQPQAGTQSFLIGQDTFQSLSGFASNAEPNWRLAHTNFDTKTCGTSSCADKYFVFWTVVWAENSQQQIIMAELPGHGLNQDMEGSQLKNLLSKDSVNMQQLFTANEQGLMELAQTKEDQTTSFSNNLGYFHQVFFIHNSEQPMMKTKSSVASHNHAFDQGQVNIEKLSLQANQINAGTEVDVTVNIKSNHKSNDALQLMIYQTDSNNTERILLDHEIISHIKADNSYQVNVPIRPEGCGKIRIEVELDPGEPGQLQQLTAAQDLTITCH